MKDKLLKIINHYGIDKQLKYIHSEYFELDEAIINMQIKKREMEGKILEVVEPVLDTYRKHIAEEIADCLVMLKQFQYNYGITDKEIEDILNYKIDRQLERIEKEEKGEKNEKD